MQAKHILLKTKLLVPTILQALEQENDFSQLAREYSACPSGQDGGNWGDLNNAALPAEMVAALEQAQAGDIVGPIQSRHGLHILKLEA